jgi:hypothetical protein
MKTIGLKKEKGTEGEKRKEKDSKGQAIAVKNRKKTGEGLDKGQEGQKKEDRMNESRKKKIKDLEKETREEE